jgi:hypothetical protein
MLPNASNMEVLGFAISAGFCYYFCHDGRRPRRNPAGFFMPGDDRAGALRAFLAADFLDRSDDWACVEKNRLAQAGQRFPIFWTDRFWTTRV